MVSYASKPPSCTICLVVKNLYVARHLNSFQVSFSDWVFVFYCTLHLIKVMPISKNLLGLDYGKLVECKACLATMFVFLYEIVGANRKV